MPIRPLPWRLLAPMLLVSLVLVAASTGAALYLRHLHIDVSRVLSENVDSTLAAKDLESTIAEMLRTLRTHSQPMPTEDIDKHLALAFEQLKKTADLANHDQEKELVSTIRTTLDDFASHWNTGQRETARELLLRLQDKVMPACRALLHYNTNKVGESNSANSHIVNLLAWGLLVVGVVAPLMGLLLGWIMARRVHQTIYQLSVRIRDAAGRLNGETRPVALVSTDGRGDLNAQVQGIATEVERVFERLHQREREVLRAEQLAAVGQVAAGVAHELRNPLMSVKMLVQTGLEGPTPTGLPPEDLGIIEHEVRRMESCIQTFLDFARPPTSSRRRTDLVGVVRRAVALIEGRARRQQVKVNIDAPHGPVELLLDGEQIHQVLVNLLLNALDALPHGGSIHIEVRGPTRDNPFVTVTVRDSGPGIPTAIRPRLFEPFVSGKETGLGLGLSISRRLVEAHGGKIHGDNAPSGGAVFTFTLPV